jgi:uncharacterized heparinase superfamily protein
MNRLALTLRTVRHLRREQWAGRALHAFHHFRGPRGFTAPADATNVQCRKPGDAASALPPPPGHFAPADASLPGEHDPARGHFRFLHMSHHLGFPVNWAAPGAELLWQYNLHYFEWLWCLPWEDARKLVLDWMARHPEPGDGAAWDAYPVSLRLQNWCANLLVARRAHVQADEAFRAALLRSLGVQAAWLARRLEWRLMGNHLLENAVALCVVGSVLEGTAADRWLARGLALLDRELPEQFLADGCHAERSPMYHLRALYALRLLEAVGAPAVRERVRPLLDRVQEAAACLVHPDGELALFNDSAIGIAHHPSDLLGTVAQPTGAWALPDAGYYGWRGGDGTAILCDAGPVGPDHQPGHAHGDLFSFECSVRGQRVIVDTGTSTYLRGPRRDIERSTAAHNTVCVEDCDQSEFWAGFRVARRARPRDVTFAREPDGFRLAGWHDGYLRLPARARHSRSLRWSVSTLEIEDRIDARRDVRATARLHLHPACRAVVEGPVARVLWPGDGCTVELGAGAWRVEPYAYAPHFGVLEPAMALACDGAGHAIHLRTTLRTAPAS